MGSGMTNRAAIIAIALLLCLPATAGAAPLRLALGPVERVNLPGAEGQRLQLALRRVLEQTAGLTVSRVTKDPGCELREAECLGRLARRLGSDRLVLLRAGRLGETTVLRLTVYDLQRRVRQGSWQEVLRHGAGTEKERQALQRMVAGFAPPPPPPPTPWYGRWWIWTAVGVAVAGGVTAAVLATRESGGPDRTITPP